MLRYGMIEISHTLWGWEGVEPVISYFLRIMCNTIKGPRLQHFHKNKQTKRDRNKGSNKPHTYAIRNATAKWKSFCAFKLSIKNTTLLTWSAKQSTF